MISAGHSIALNLSRMECLKEWITQLSGTLGFNHLLRAALAEVELHFCSLQYLGKAKVVFCSFMRVAARKDAPTNGILRRLDEVFRDRHVCSQRFL